MPDFVDTMAFVGEVPWHKLGTYLGDQNVDGATMLRASGLDWHVEKVPAYYLKGDTFERIPDQYTLTRSDTGASLGVAVGSKYTAFQNAQLFSFAEALRKEGDVKFHTAGSLHEGRKVWALAQISGELSIRRSDGTRDTSAPFLLLYNTHDGSACITARFTSVRVVCWNTLSAALGEKNVAEFRAKHTSSAEGRARDAATVLGLAAETAEHERETLQALADVPMDAPAFATFAAQMLTGEDDPEAAVERIAKSEGRSLAQYERKGSTLAQLFSEGLGNLGESRLDALNAVTEYVDHQRARLEDWRQLDARLLNVGADSAWFGNGERMKRRALALLTV